MHFKKKILCSMLASSSVFSMTALAEGYQLEEIVVTAQKRSESSQEVPISILAMSGDSLANAGITSSTDLGMVTPSLNIQQSGVGNTIFLRGLGNQDATGGQEGSVGVYVDGLWYGSVTGNALSLNSIERIEVLKGPQGTLFGRNTTGGVINVVTKDPEQETSGNISASYGNYERSSVKFYGTTGVTDNIAADVTVMMSDQGEGYGENLAAGTEINKREDEHFVRTKWLYTGDATDVTFAASYEEFSDDTGYARGVPKNDGLDFAGQPAPSNSHDVNNDTAGWADFENTAVSLRIDHSFEAIDVVSITGYKKDSVDSLTDNDYSPATFLDAAIEFYNEAYTQEFQFISNGSGSISWIGGLFFLDSRAGSDITISGPLLWGGDFLNDQRFAGEISTRSYAAFGEMEFAVTDTQSLTLGLRYTYDKREVEGVNYYNSYTGVMFGGTGPLYSALDPTFTSSETATPDQEESWSEPTWRIVYDVQLTDDFMVYTSYNRGFRSGNFNAVSPQDPAFEPEVVDAYEIGMKSELLDGTMRLNAALFYYDAQDLQFQTLEGTTARTINAAGATIQGVEFDMTWLATNNLTLVLGGSYSDSEYEGFDNAQGYNAGGGAPFYFDASGNQLTKAPRKEASLGVIYSLPTSHGEYLSDLRFGYNAGFPWEPDGRLKTDSYTLVNWTLGWTSPDQVWGVRFLGKNLLDEEYPVHTASSALGDFYASADPRTYSVSVSYDF